MQTRLILLATLFVIAASAFAQDAYHTLKDGETLYGVARAYGVGVDALIAANKLGDVNKIRSGQKILIPGRRQVAPAPASPGAALPAPAAPAASASSGDAKSRTQKHTVQKGDTLYSIARRYDCSVSELRGLNKLTEKSVLKAGQVLAIPAQAGVPAASPAASPAETPSPAPEAVVPAASALSKERDPQPELRPINQKAGNLNLRWPVKPKELAYMDGKIYGVLITGEKSERVESLTGGTVVSAEAYRGFGKVAIVQAPDGLVYVYGGNEALSVKVGDKIASGAELGKLGLDGLTGKAQLFLLVFKENKAIDPAKAPRS